MNLGDRDRFERWGVRISDVRSSAFVCLGFVVLLVGCGSNRAAPSTDLTMVAVNPSVGRSVFHLECTPTDGDLPDPARACAALAANPRLVSLPRPFNCAGGTFSWWDITISGRLNGAPIRRAFSTCWTPQMETLGRFGMDWRALNRHLLPRRHQALLAGTNRTFSRGLLRPADLVTCDILGHHLALGVPLDNRPGASTGYGGANIVSVTLTVSHHRDGTVSASCHRGGS